MKAKRIPTPAPGYAVIRVRDCSETASGIVIAGQSAEPSALDMPTRTRFVVVKTSGKYPLMGQWIDHGAAVGDEVLVRIGTRAAPPHWADDPQCQVICLADVIAWHPCPVDASASAAHGEAMQ